MKIYLKCLLSVKFLFLKTYLYYILYNNSSVSNKILFKIRGT